MHLPVNTLLQGGKYRIVRFISSGGFGCTYEAVHVMLEERVAIKEFFVKDFCNRDEATAHVTVGTVSKKGLVEKLQRKFIDEAKALRKLHHPGIVSVSDVFEENGTAYYVMDFVEGRSLSDRVNTEGPLPEARALGYIRQAADALAYVHSQNRLHLDLKPGNIMIDGSDRAVLIDFGASKQYDEVEGENTSTLLGKTPGYAPPEQMSNSVVKFLPATDIYALGATLYKLLTGITPPDALLRISGEKVEPIPTTISASTRAAIEKALILDKTNRPQTVAAFVALLDGKSDAAAGASVSEETVLEPEAAMPDVPKVTPARPTEPPQPAPQQTPRPTSRNKYIVAVGAVVVIALLAGFFGFRHRATEPAEPLLAADSLQQDSVELLAESVTAPEKPAADAHALQAQRQQEEQARLATEQRQREEAERQRLAEEARVAEERRQEESVKKYDQQRPYKEGLAAVNLDGKWGFIDASKNEVIPLIYEELLEFTEGLAAAKLNNKWGYIDKKGKEIIPFSYDNAWSFTQEGLADVFLNGKFGFIDKRGSFAIPLKYEVAYPFSEGLAAVQLNGKVGFINTSDNLILPYRYEAAHFFSGGIANVKINGKWGYIDKKGSIVIPPIYDYAETFIKTTGQAKVKLNGEEFHIDKNGNRVD